MKGAAGPVLTVEDLTMAYGEVVLQRDINFSVNRGDIFFIIGGSGCGKSTLLRHLIGLQRPAAGRVLYGATDLWSLDDEQRAALMRHAGVLYQGNALWSSMTLAENVALPLHHYTNLEPSLIRELVMLKLSNVGLVGFKDYYPSALSGGMRKRAAIARAIALDPEFLLLPGVGIRQCGRLFQVPDPPGAAGQAQDGEPGDRQTLHRVRVCPQAAPAQVVRQGKYLEIPTMPSDLEELTQAMEELPLRELAKTALSALKGINRLVNSGKLEQGLATFNTTMQHMDSLVVNTDRRQDAMDPKISRLLAGISVLATTADNLLTRAGQDMTPAVRDLRQTLVSINRAAGSLEQTLNSMQEVINDNRQLPDDLDRSLDEVRRAARTMQDLAAYLRRHPSALLTGPEEEKP